jgi:hypothetical protein
VPKPLSGLATEAMNSQRAELNPLQTTAYVRISAREHLSGWEALRLCARTEPGCTNQRATVILLQAFSSREVGLSHRNGPYNQVFGEQDWTKYTVDLQSGTIDHPSGVDLNCLRVSARGLASWLGKQREHVAVPKRGPRPALVQNADSVSDRTGARGRPTSAHLIIAEFQRRADERQVLPTLAGEAKHLSTWLLTTYPDLAPMKPVSVESKIRRAYRQWRATKRWVYVSR